MSLTIQADKFLFPRELRAGVAGRRVLITGAGKDCGLGQAFAIGAGLNGAQAVAVHFHTSYEDGLETVELINRHGGHAFPVQADVTSPGDVWAMRSYVMDKMGGKAPDLVICNSGLSENGYLLGRPPAPIEGESAATRRARVRKAFVDNLTQSRAVLDTKLDGFLAMTHLWAGEALNSRQPLQIVYISSRQALEPGAGVPGYVAANWGVLVYPQVLAANLGRDAGLVSAFSVAYPFVRTGMTEAYVANPKVFGRWQPRMLETHEAGLALAQLLCRPAEELDRKTFRLDVDRAESTPDALRVTWTQVTLEAREARLLWSHDEPLVFGGEPAPQPVALPVRARKA